MGGSGKQKRHSKLSFIYIKMYEPQSDNIYIRAHLNKSVLFKHIRLIACEVGKDMGIQGNKINTRGSL